MFTYSRGEKCSHLLSSEISSFTLLVKYSTAFIIHVYHKAICVHNILHTCSYVFIYRSWHVKIHYISSTSFVLTFHVCSSEFFTTTVGAVPSFPHAYSFLLLVTISVFVLLPQPPFLFICGVAFPQYTHNSSSNYTCATRKFSHTFLIQYKAILDLS